MQVYLVGGAVRDQLLQIPVFDRDWVVVGATPELMRARGFQPVGKDFPVFLHPDTHEEYALARTERKSGRGYQGFAFHAAPDVTLEQDLLRRDLTINAMAQAPDGSLIDPYGGQQDLDARILRHVSPAFAEDPLRVLRVARFAARFHHLGFRVAPATLELMTQLATSDELAELSAERVWKELERALGEPSPHVFFTTLAACNGLDHWLPELRPLFANDQPQPSEALQRICQQRADSSTRLAVLLAQLNLPPHSSTPSEHPVAAVNCLMERLKAPKAFRDEALLLTRFAPRLEGFSARPAPEQLALYEGLDLSRRPDRLAPFSNGGCALIPMANPQALNRLCQTVEAVQPKVLVSEGFKGKALGEELRRRRLQRIEEQCYEPAQQP
ncbi:MAG TPA: hypothetical protein VIS52_00450 [Motiliproteus sp.]